MSSSGTASGQLLALFALNLERLRRLLADPEGCTCSSWAETLPLTYDIPGVS